MPRGKTVISILAALTLAALLALPAQSLAAKGDAAVGYTSGSRGHMAFFFIGNLTTKKLQSAFADFIFYYEKVKPTLQGAGFTYSYHSSLPIDVKNGDLTLSLGTPNLTQAAGVVMIKHGGRFRIVYGVYSDVALMKIAREYFSH